MENEVESGVESDKARGSVENVGGAKAASVPAAEAFDDLGDLDDLDHLGELGEGDISRYQSSMGRSQQVDDLADLDRSLR